MLLLGYQICSNVRRPGLSRLLVLTRHSFYGLKLAPQSVRDWWKMSKKGFESSEGTSTRDLWNLDDQSDIITGPSDKGNF